MEIAMRIKGLIVDPVSKIPIVVLEDSESKNILPVPFHGGRGPGLYPGIHFRREGSSLDQTRISTVSLAGLGTR
jgi:hypothetical protein